MTPGTHQGTWGRWSHTGKRVGFGSGRVGSRYIYTYIHPYLHTSIHIHIHTCIGRFRWMDGLHQTYKKPSCIFIHIPPPPLSLFFFPIRSSKMIIVVVSCVVDCLTGITV